MPRFVTSSSWVIPMPVSRITSTFSFSRPSITISSGVSSRCDSSVSDTYLILSSASDALEISSRTAISGL